MERKLNCASVKPPVTKREHELVHVAYHKGYREGFEAALASVAEVAVLSIVEGGAAGQVRHNDFADDIRNAL